MSYIIGVDIGGTFTDCVVIDAKGAVAIAKAPSTPPDFEHGFIDSIRIASSQIGLDLETLLATCDGIYHGCTVGTNALVEGSGSKVALLVTRGHRDSIFFMQSGRRLRTMPPEYIARISEHQKPPPLVPKDMVREIDERVTVDGAVFATLDEDGTRKTVSEMVERGVSAFAISLLWSVSNDEHEQRVAEIVRALDPKAFISVASEVVPRIGEYERTVATVINSVVGPVMDRYLGALAGLLSDLGYKRPVQVMSCSGGLLTADEARARPVLTIGSGPVAGVVGSLKLSTRDAGESSADVITADMGGTTLDVGVIRNGTALSSATAWHGQYEYFVPTIDVRSIGAGGGSIVSFVEALGTFRVGPKSAGARPGPACYGRGGQLATVTDADLVLGYLGDGDFAGGTMKLDINAARAALARVGEALGYGPDETAAAAVRIVDAQMADAIRLASVQQGYDPRQFTLYAYGGAGPIHAVALARELALPRVIVPLSDLASGWSAFGVAGSEALVVEEAAVKMRDPFDAGDLNEIWSQLESQAVKRLTKQGIDEERIRLERRADMRYTLQVNQVQVTAPCGVYEQQQIDELIYAYETEYARLFGEGTGYASAGYAITLLRVEGKARLSEFELTTHKGGVASAPVSTRQVTFVGPKLVTVETAIYDGRKLLAGHTLEGPAIVEYPHTSVVIAPGSSGQLDSLGSLVIELEETL